MNAEIVLLSAAGGVIAALAPLIYLFYYTRPVTFTVWTGAVVSFIGGFIFTLLVLQWGSSTQDIPTSSPSS